MPNVSTASAAEMADTNVLIYAYDPTDPLKHARAIQLTQDLIAAGRLALSVQVLNEFYARATRPDKPPALSHQRAGDIVRRLIRVAAVLPITASVTLLAAEAVPQYSFSFWDALLWAAAKENGITLLHTEDMPSAPEIDGVRYHNPFAGGP